MGLQIEAGKGVVWYGSDGVTLKSSGYSAGHIGFSALWEYFEHEGAVYRAPIQNPIQSVEPLVRQGARWECSRTHFEHYRQLFELEEGK